jgi:hypothetical protein
MGRVVQIAQVGGLHHRYDVLPPEQAPLFAYSQLGHVVQLFFLCRRTHPPNRISGSLPAAAASQGKPEVEAFGCRRRQTRCRYWADGVVAKFGI